MQDPIAHRKARTLPANAHFLPMADSQAGQVTPLQARWGPLHQGLEAVLPVCVVREELVAAVACLSLCMSSAKTTSLCWRRRGKSTPLLSVTCRSWSQPRHIDPALRAPYRLLHLRPPFAAQTMNRKMALCLGRTRTSFSSDCMTTGLGRLISSKSSFTLCDPRSWVATPVFAPAIITSITPTCKSTPV